MKSLCVREALSLQVVENVYVDMQQLSFSRNNPVTGTASNTKKKTTTTAASVPTAAQPFFNVPKGFFSGSPATCSIDSPCCHLLLVF